jgi:hypothetical protein
MKQMRIDDVEDEWKRFFSSKQLQLEGNSNCHEHAPSATMVILQGFGHDLVQQMLNILCK